MNETCWPCLFLSKLKPKNPKKKCYLNCGFQFKQEKGIERGGWVYLLRGEILELGCRVYCHC